MAEKKNAVSFDDLIQADRARKKNEQVANEIFGRNRQSTNKDKNNRAQTSTPSLASRVGVQKRSSSTNSLNSPRSSFSRNNSSNNTPHQQRDRSNRLSHALSSQSSPQSNLSPRINPQSTSKPAQRKGFSIKGKAGPFTVSAANFAPGTTTADIESALSSDAIDSDGNSALLSCRLTSTHPAVVAEIVFSERAVAEKIINMYNDQLADGRTLKLALKNTPPSQPAANTNRPTTYSKPTAPSAPTADLIDPTPPDIEMAIDDQPPTATSTTQPQSHYTDDREAQSAARDRRERDLRRTDPSSSQHPEDDRDYAYEDTSSRPQDLSSPEQTRNGSNNRRDEDPERERERERDRSRNREHDHDHDRHRDDHRGEREGGSGSGSGGHRDRHREHDSQRDPQPSSGSGSGSRRYDYDRRYDNSNRGYERGGRSSHYGNGVGMGMGMQQQRGGGYGGGGGGGFGGPGRGGRGLYSDNMRGGRGWGPRGGGYR